MIKVFGKVKVLDVQTKTVANITVAELICNTMNGTTYNNVKICVPVNKHANFLKGKIVVFEGEIHDNNEIWADLKNINTVDYGTKNGNGNQNSQVQYNNRKYKQKHSSNPPAQKQANNPPDPSDDDKIPF